MPIARFQMPDGRIARFEVPEGTTPEQAQVMMEQAMSGMQPAAAPMPKKGIGAAVSQGFESMLSTGQTALGALTGDPDEVAAAALRRREELSGKYAEQTGLDLLKKVYEEKGLLGGAKEVVRQVPLAIAEQAPNLAAMFGGARLGAMAGSAVAPGVGTVIGGIGGALIPSAVQQFGTNVERRAAEGLPADFGISAATAAPQAGLDVVGTLIPFGGKLVTKLTGIPMGAFMGRSAAQAEKIANERLLATLAKGTAAGMAAEIPTEIAQQMLERAQAGLSLSSPDAMEEYGRTAYQVGLLGPLGAVGRVSEKMGAQEDILQRQKDAQAAVFAELTKPPEPTPVPAEVAPVVEAEPLPTALAPLAPKTAPTAPVELAPTAEPVYTPPAGDLPSLMDQHRTMALKLDPFETQLQAAAAKGDTAAITALLPQYNELKTQVQQLGTHIEKLGGTTVDAATFETTAASTLADYDKEIAAAQKKLANAGTLGDFEALPKLGTKLDTLKAERDKLTADFEAKRGVLAEQQKGLTQRGETRPLFTEAEAPPTDIAAPAEEKLVSYKGKPITLGATAKEAAPVAVAGVSEKTKAELAALQKKLDEATAARDTLVKTMPKPRVLPIPSAQITQASSPASGFNKLYQKQVGQEDIVPAQRRAYTQQLYVAQQRITNLQNAIARLTPPATERKELLGDELGDTIAKADALRNDIYKKVGTESEETRKSRLQELDTLMVRAEDLKKQATEIKEEAPTGMYDLFGDFNLLNTAINDRNPQVLANMHRARQRADQKALEARQPKRTPREQVAELLNFRIGKIIRRERNYDVREIETGERKGQEVFVSDDIAAEIARLRDVVEKPVGNAKRSLLQQLHDEFDLLEKRDTALQEAIAAGASEAKLATLRNQVATAQTRYEKKLARVAPYRAKLDAQLAKLYKETEIQTPRQKEAELQALGTSARVLSREVKQAKKSTKAELGLKAQAELDAVLDDVVREVGYQTEEYQKLVGPAQKKLNDKVELLKKFIDTSVAKLEVLKAEKGEDSKKYNTAVTNFIKQKKDRTQVVDAFAKSVAADLEAKARAIGATSPALAEAQEKAKKEFAKREKPVTAAQEALDAKKAELEKFTDEGNAKLDALKKEHGEDSAKYKKAEKEFVQQGNTLRNAVASMQNVAYQRGTQATRNIAKLGEIRTESEESRADTSRKQATFEAKTPEPAQFAEAYGRTSTRPDFILEAKQREAAPKKSKGKTNVQVALRQAATEKIAANKKMERDFKEGFGRDVEEKRFAIGSETESKDLSNEQVKLLEDNKLQDAYKSISEDDTNQPLNRAVSLALEVFADNTAVKLHDKLYAPDGQEVLGMATSRVVDLSRNGGLTQEVLLHEGTHAAVERVIQMAQDDITLLSKEQQAAYRELEALYNSAKKDPSITSANAKSNISEFAAEVLSNENLQKQLKQKKWRTSDAFRGFVSIILKMIGVTNVDNMLDASVSAVEALMISTSSAQPVTEQVRAKPKEDVDVGVYEKTKGDFGFKSKIEPVTVASSFVASKPSFKDEFMGNVLGLKGRVQFIDQHAALSAAFKQGVAAEQISSLEAEQGEFYLRFSQQTSQFAGQALTNGPVELRKAEGGGYIYASKPGANMVQVAEAVSKANVGNDTQTEAMFTAYLAGKRAEVVGWDKLSFDNPKLAQKEYNDVLNILKADKQAADAFKEAADIYQQYNNGQLDLLVQTGYLSEKLAADLKKTPYVPFYRTNRSGNVELVIDKENIVTLSNIKDEPQLKALVGDNTQIQPVFTSAVQNTFMITNMALRNQMMKDSSFLLKKMGIASAIGKSTQSRVTNQKEIDDAALKGVTVEPKYKDVDVTPVGPDVVRFKIKGEDHFVLIDTDMYGIPADLIVKGMEGIKTTLPAVFKLMGIPADVLRKFVTRNPAYAVKQAFRDPLTAWMTTGTDGVPVLNSFKELSKMVAGRSEEQAKLMASGAISSNVFSGDERDMSKFLKDLSVGKMGYHKIMAKLDAFAIQGDAATRAVVYKDSLNKGMSEMQALLRTLESMNFSRRGLSPSMQVLSTIIPFFNAQIQGLDVLYRAFTNQMPHSEQLKIRQKMLMRGLMLAAGTMAYAAMMQDDEAYKRAKPEERLANWFVYIPGVDEPMRVPIPFELGYLFKALPEAIFNMAADDERSSDITKGMGKLLALSNPFALPQAVKPLTEVVLGRSFFSGDIESSREQQTMLPTERYRDTTTEFAKLLGSATGDAGLTPIKIDYLMRGYMGGLGLALVSLANPILNMEGKAEVADPTKKISKMPFIGGMFQPIEGRGTLDAAYERMQEIQQTKGSFNKLIEEGKKDEAKAFAIENIDKISGASMSGSVQKQLGELAKYRRQVIASPRLTTEQKDKLLEKLDSAQVKIARNFITVTDRTTRQ